MVDKQINFDALGQALDTTWGRSSTPNTTSYSVKLKMMGPERVEALYLAVVNFGTEKQMIDMRRMYSDEADRAIAAYIKRSKNLYKELTGDSITFKEQSYSDSVEIIGMSAYTPNRTAYFRKKIVFEMY